MLINKENNPIYLISKMGFPSPHNDINPINHDKSLIYID